MARFFFFVSSNITSHCGATVITTYRSLVENRKMSFPVLVFESCNSWSCRSVRELGTKSPPVPLENPSYRSSSAYRQESNVDGHPTQLIRYCVRPFTFLSLMIFTMHYAAFAFHPELPLITLISRTIPAVAYLLNPQSGKSRIRHFAGPWLFCTLA